MNIFDYNKIYYKLMESSECHHGFQYKDGLNVDTAPFNPSGSSEPGGLYFTIAEHLERFLCRGVWYREWVMRNIATPKEAQFLDYRVIIREITIPEDALVYPDPKPRGDNIVWKSDKMILGARHDLREVETYEWLSDIGVNLNPYKNSIVRWASASNYLDIAKYFIDSGNSYHALHWASFTKNHELEKYVNHILRQDRVVHSKGK